MFIEFHCNLISDMSPLVFTLGCYGLDLDWIHVRSDLYWNHVKSGHDPAKITWVRVEISCFFSGLR